MASPQRLMTSTWLLLGLLVTGSLAHAQQPLSVSGGGTGQTAFPLGRVIFGSGTSPLQSDANLVWNSRNQQLTIASPSAPRLVSGSEQV